MLLFILKPGIAKDNTELKAELTDILQTVPVKEWKMIENKQVEEKMTKFEMVSDDTIKDPYDQIRTFVNETDMDYFNQLKTHMETKDSVEQVRCKAVVYAILQDTELNQEQRQILALAYFERLAKMPGSNYRFRLAGNEKYKEDATYADKRNRYSWYKSYLDVVALKEEIAKLNKKSKSLDEKSKSLDEEIQKLQKENETLDRQIKLFQWLLETYQNYKK